MTSSPNQHPDHHTNKSASDWWDHHGVYSRPSRDPLVDASILVASVVAIVMLAVLAKGWAW